MKTAVLSMKWPSLLAKNGKIMRLELESHQYLTEMLFKTHALTLQPDSTFVKLLNKRCTWYKLIQTVK